jgi:hypothetical protein
MGCHPSTPVYLPIRYETLPPLRSIPAMTQLDARFPPPFFLNLRYRSWYCLVRKDYPGMDALLEARSDEDWRVVDGHFFCVSYALLEIVMYGD